MNTIAKCIVLQQLSIIHIPVWSLKKLVKNNNDIKPHILTFELTRVIICSLELLI